MKRFNILASLLLGVSWGCSPAVETVDLPDEETIAVAVNREFPGRDPSIRWDAEGRLHVVYVQQEEGREPWVEYRQLVPEMTEPVQVSAPDRSVKSRNEVPPVIEVQPDGRVVVAYTVTLPGKRQGEFLYQTSSDDGRTWSTALPVHDDGRPTGSRSFVDSALLPDGRVAFSWLDNRLGQQGLIYAELSAEGGVDRNVVLDEVTCQCCGTDLIAGDDGTVFLAYREFDESTGVRDIAMMRRQSDDDEFAPMGIVSPDGWEIDGCPHTGPRLTGDLWATWFTGVEPSVRVTHSIDGGESFSAAENLAVIGGEVRRVSHPEIGLLPDGRLIALYETGRESSNEIFVRRHDGSAWGVPELLVEDAVYPRFETNGERSVVAWTEQTNGTTRVVVREIG